jgi:hypothetical protein
MKKNIAAFLAMAILALSVSLGASAAEVSVVIGTPPPAPIIEAVPVAPGPDAEYFWRPGYWRWVDERHVWIPGHWAHRPHPEAVWVVPEWEHGADGYRFHEGHWR